MGRWLSILAACGVLCGSGASSADAPGDAQTARLAAFAPPAAIPYPDGDPPSPAKARLGENLFFDPILSGARTISCATCHDPKLSWSDGRARAVGASGSPMALRSPTLLDVAWMGRLGWDGKFRDIEAVTFAPVTAHDNMNLAEAEAVARLRAVPDYLRRFEEAFGTPDIDRRAIERALATYERSIVSVESPFDRWVAGDGTAVTPAAKRGFALFDGRAGCSSCHAGWAFSDGSFHDIGIATGGDIGRGRLFPTSIKLRYAFKTPTLRDVARRGPYMHDGSLPTLRAVIDLYDRGGVVRPSLSPEIRPRGLSEGDKDDLLAFLATLGPATAPSD